MACDATNTVFLLNTPPLWHTPFHSAMLLRYRAFRCLILLASLPSTVGPEPINHHTDSRREATNLSLTAKDKDVFSESGSLQTMAGLSCAPTKQRRPHLPDRTVFVHIFKAAGSTIREKLRGFALTCGHGWACLIHCQKTQLLSTDGSVINCELKDVINSPRLKASSHADVQVHETKPKTDHIVKFDILGGHVTIPGITGLFARSGLPYRVRYVTVLREPMASLASGIRFSRPEFGLPAVVDALQKRIENNVSCWNAVYYLSAGGRDYEEAQETLLRRFALVGLVENWKVTMKMFQLFFDPTLMYNGWFDRRRENLSPGDFSTSHVLDALSEGMLFRLRTICNDELELYSAALVAHRNTCEAILTDNGKLHLPSYARCNCTLKSNGARSAVRCA